MIVLVVCSGQLVRRSQARTFMRLVLIPVVHGRSIIVSAGDFGLLGVDSLSLDVLRRGRVARILVFIRLISIAPILSLPLIPTLLLTQVLPLFSADSL